MNMMTHKDEDPIGGLMFPVLGHLVVFVLCDPRIQGEEGLRAIVRARFPLWWQSARVPPYGGVIIYFARW
jgi:hypothetical protein